MLRTKPLSLRPHHALCLLLFNPTGHSAPYSAVMRKLLGEIALDAAQELVLSFALDMICGYCPHNDAAVCGKEEETAASDEKLILICGLSTQIPVRWDVLRGRLCDFILKPGRLAEVCQGCVYLARCERVAERSLLLSNDGLYRF